LLLYEVIVEEKLDGANLGISVSQEGYVRAQNRFSARYSGRCCYKKRVC
jgi:hypothetical protein